MNSTRTSSALFALQWILGLVILAEAAAFAFSPREAAAFAKTGMPNYVRLLLAWGEMATATLFLIPRAVIVGGYSLIAVLACALVLHLLHGWIEVGSLIVYSTAVWTVIAEKRKAV